MEVSTVLIDYLASVKHLGVKSQVGYQQGLSVFADWCTLAGVMLQQVNNRNVQAFLEWLRTSHIRQARRNYQHRHLLAMSDAFVRYCIGVWMTTI